MFRTSDVVLIAVMLSAAAFTYKTKHDAQAMMNRIDALETEIRLEKDAIDVLKADWSLLTQPERLQELTEIYEEELGLQGLDARQIISLESLRDIPFGNETFMVQGEPVGDGQDPVVTGGVR
ncbi:cell division protein FtsL [Chelativorans sp. YIM 93263]|uniref:cell division protein FtsL n=1 Tax=Chelativorans sp. YIM 93263 TaxID=2906648 RepID=UPI00237982CD|nr:hypothetical protein [Chelativorans sp. YIM 93263]